MTRKNSSLLAAAVLAIACTGEALANSCPAGTSARVVKGKIFDQLSPEGKTLGVVHLRVDEKTNVKCGMAGSGTVGAGTISLNHLLVCDDSVRSSYGTENIHSQVALITTGTSDLTVCSSQPGVQGTFHEIAVPSSDPLLARGMFQGVQGGRIVIDGTVNCGQAIDAKFEGYFCVPSQ